MLYFFIEKNKYALPQRLDEIKLKNWKSASLIQEKEEVNKLDFISAFLDIPVAQLKKVRLTDEKYFGIKELYDYLLNFMATPEYFEPVPEFEYKGIKYRAFSENLNILENNKLPEEMTFQEYEDMTTVMNNFDELKDKDADALSYLAAILYRPTYKKGFIFKKEYPEPYNSDKVEERAKLFNELTMDKIFSAYFFLINRVNTLARNLEIYSKQALK